MGKMIKLNEAVGTHSPDRGIYNSYNWYRQQAKNQGSILIGDTKIPARKIKGTWFVDGADFDRAINVFINQKAAEKERARLMMEDHQKGIFHHGIVWISDCRYYVNKGEFRLEVDIYRLYRNRSDGTWYCNTCNLPAETEHNNPECHVCADWGSCGRDCTLSKVYCSHCGKSLDIPRSR